MARLVRWDPFRETVSLRRMMDRLFDESFVAPPRATWLTWRGDGDVPINMWETPDELVIDAAVPGFAREEIQVSIEGDTVTIKGEHKAEETAEDVNYICRERRDGSFQRSVGLPENVMTDEATADYHDGMLTLTFPTREEAKPKRIEVKTEQHRDGWQHRAGEPIQAPPSTVSGDRPPRTSGSVRA